MPGLVSQNLASPFAPARWLDPTPHACRTSTLAHPRPALPRLSIRCPNPPLLTPLGPRRPQRLPPTTHGTPTPLSSGTRPHHRPPPLPPPPATPIPPHRPTPTPQAIFFFFLFSFFLPYPLIQPLPILAYPALIASTTPTGASQLPSLIPNPTSSPPAPASKPRTVATLPTCPNPRSPRPLRPGALLANPVPTTLTTPTLLPPKPTLILHRLHPPPAYPNPRPNCTDHPSLTSHLPRPPQTPQHCHPPCACPTSPPRPHPRARPCPCFLFSRPVACPYLDN